VDERLVTGEEAVPAGQQVSLQPALAEVFGENLHDPPVGGEVLVTGSGGRHPGPVGDLEGGTEPIGGDLVRAEEPEGLWVRGDDIADPVAERAGGAGDRRTGARHVDRVVAEVGQHQITQHLPAVGDRVGAHPAVALRRQLQQLGDRRPGRVEELLRAVAAQPALQLGQVLRVLPHLRQRHLVGAKSALHLLVVDLARAGPALRRTEHDHRPARALDRATRPGPLLDGGDLVQRPVHGRGECLVHRGRIVPGDQVRLVTVPAHQVQQVGLGDSAQHRRVGDLVAVEVQDGQHRTVAGRVQEHVRQPATGQRPGLRLAVADHARDQQVRVVERGTVGVAERVPELTPLVNGPRHLRGHVAGNATGEGELAEELGHAGFVLAGAVVALAPGALQPGVRHDRGTAVAGTGDVDGVQVAGDDDPVEVRVQQVQTGTGAPVPEEPRLDVLHGQRLAQQRVAPEVDLPDSEVVRRPPVRVQSA